MQQKRSSHHSRSAPPAVNMDLQQHPGSSAIIETSEAEMKTIAVRRVKDGESVQEAAKFCGVSEQQVQRWVTRKPRCTLKSKDNRKLLAVVRKHPTISIKEAMALSNYPAGEQTARKHIKESNINYVGPKKGKRPLEVGSSNWVLALNNELQKVIDVFNAD
jgi:DNA-binding transcriptional regulator YiaG